MEKMKIYFSDGSNIIVTHGDYITPIIWNNTSHKEPFYSITTNIYLELHIHNGLVPSFIEAIHDCDYFHINGNQYIAYAKSAIVKLEVI